MAPSVPGVIPDGVAKDIQYRQLKAPEAWPRDFAPMCQSAIQDGADEIRLMPEVPTVPLAMTG